jgi:kinesin family protein C2/C3
MCSCRKTRQILTDLFLSRSFIACFSSTFSSNDLPFGSQILSELDVFAVVGGNRPLQVLDIRATVESNGSIVIDFRGVRGNPMVCGICIRRGPALPGN